MWWEVITDSLLDTLKLFPFFFVLYILIELMEHKTRVGKPSRLLTGRLAPLIGTATGLVPMCGFSVMAAKLYRHRHVTLGALIAVFIATSDEGLLVLLLSEAAWDFKLLSALALLGSKLILGMGIGYLVDCLVKRREMLPLPEAHEHEHGHEEHSHVHEDHDHDHEEHDHDHDGHAHHDQEEEAHEDNCACAELTACEHKKESGVMLYLVSPLLHALQVAGFVLLVNLFFGFLFFWLGAENVRNFLQGAGYWYQPAICALIGLVPNCASSVVITETYILGGIGFGGLLGGLVANAGLGYVALFRKKEDTKSAILIMAVMFLLGTAIGYLTNALALAIP